MEHERMGSIHKQDDDRDRLQGGHDRDEPGGTREVAVSSPGTVPPFTTRERGNLRRWLWLLVAVHLWLSVHGAVDDAQTMDEGIHLAAGVTYWTTGDRRLNPEHPALWKLVATLPVLAARPAVPLQDPSWARADGWGFARAFMAANRPRAHQLLLFGRLMNVVAGASLVLAIGLLGERLFSARAGLVAAALAAFDPTVIAHSRYVTTDVPVTLGITLSVAFFVSAVHRPSRKNFILLTLVVVATSFMKYSGLLLILCLPLMWLLAGRERRPWSGRRLFAGLLIGLAAGIALLYPHLQRPADDPRVQELLRLRTELADHPAKLAAYPPLIQRAIAAADPTTHTGRALQRVLSLRVPAYWYWRGLFAVSSHTLWGQRAYLLGRTSETGWRWYFPVAFIVKTPLPTLALIGLAAAAVLRWRRERRRLPWGLGLIAVPLALYLLGTFISRLNLGLRHLLPVYPFLFLVVGWAVVHSGVLRARVSRLVIVGALVLLPVSTLAVHPYEIASFSALVGGVGNGWRYLLDSNLDWGQDLLRLKRTLTRLGTDRVALAYYGTADPSTYGIDAQPLGTSTAPATTTYAAVSLSMLVGEWPRYAWVTTYPLAARVGSSILLYRIR